MLSTKLIQELTKSEIMLYNSIQNSDNFDYSIAEMMRIFNISKQTVCNSLRRLVEKKLVLKTTFFIGRIQRNKYSVNNTPKGKLTSQKTDETVENNRVSDIKKESRRTTNRFLKPIINTISSNDMINDINNINNISKSNHIDNTVFNDSCQEGNLKNLIKKVPNKIDFDKTLTDIFDDFSSSPLPDNFTIGMFKDLITKMWREKNDNSKAVIKFLNNESSNDVKEVITGVINSFCTRMLDTQKDSIKNISGYIRTSIVNAVQNFNENKSKTKQFFNSCKELINYTSKNKNAKICQNNGYFNGKKSSYKDFEQRDYSSEFLNSFYHGACVEGGV